MAPTCKDKHLFLNLTQHTYIQDGGSAGGGENTAIWAWLPPLKINELHVNISGHPGAGS